MLVVKWWCGSAGDASSGATYMCAAMGAANVGAANVGDRVAMRQRW